MNLLTARRENVCPMHLVEGFETYLNERKYQGEGEPQEDQHVLPPQRIPHPLQPRLVFLLVGVVFSVAIAGIPCVASIASVVASIFVFILHGGHIQDDGNPATILATQL